MVKHEIENNSFSPSVAVNCPADSSQVLSVAEVFHSERFSAQFSSL
jgi:hypothetical protein